MVGSAHDGRRGHAKHWRILGWGTAAGLVLLPLFAMRLTNEVAWEVGDFVMAGILIGGTGLAFELAVRMTASRPYRAGAAIALGAAFLDIWINLAVGIIGSEDNPANLMYFGVLAVGALGAVAGRFRPAGMARAMFATAIAQVLVFVVALIAGLGFTGPVTVFFTALWLASAWLFRKAAREQTSGCAAT